MTGDVTPRALREAIAETLWCHVKAHDLAEVCGELGLAPPQGQGGWRPGAGGRFG